MEAAAIQQFEQRATSAEERLAALENKLANGTSLRNYFAINIWSLTANVLADAGATEK